MAARTVRDVLAGITPGNERSLGHAALLLDTILLDVPALPDDPEAAWLEVDDRGAEVRNTWQEVRAARDHGELSEADYEFLARAVDSINLEV